ncbi:MAG: polyphenol oxidase family protein [Thermodesulfobacteriota bacterium]
MPDALSLIPFAFPGAPGVRCAFTTRSRGASAGPFGRGNLSFDVGDDPQAVMANRLALRERLGFREWRECRQVHGPDLAFDPEPGELLEGEEREGDGLATARPGLALCVKTADCQPVLLAHRSGKHVAALHVGWRGNVLNLPATGVARFCAAYKLDPADVYAVRGPSLGPGAAEFTNFEAEFGARFASWHDPATRTVNLWRLTHAQLLQAGLRHEHIFHLDLCTWELESEFFSYRREKVTGRMASVIWIEGR